MQKQFNPGIAAVLSMVIPGAGQIYERKLGRGLIWLAVVLMGYALLIVPGIILHLFCIISAYSADPYAQKKEHKSFKLT